MGYSSLLIAVALVTGALYCPHLYLRERLAESFKDPDRDADAWLVFRCAWRVYPLFLSVALVSIGVLAWATGTLGGVLAFAGIVMAPTGVLCIFADLYQHYFSTRSQRPYWHAHPPPKLQFRMMDCYAGLFVYGMTMAVFAAPAQHAELDGASVAGYAVFLLLNVGFGVYVALDVLRRSNRLQRPLHRALFVACLTAYTCFLLPFTFLSWRAWRYALWKRDNPPPRSQGFLPTGTNSRL